MSFQHVRDADPDVWDKQATSWSRLASDLEHTPGDLKRAAGKLDGWHGAGADAAFTYLKGLHSDYEDAAEALEEIPRVLRWLADQVRDAQKTIHRVINTVNENDDLDIRDDETGEVHTGNGVAPGDGRDQDTVQEDQAIAQELTKLNEQAVTDATEADHTAKGRLAKLTPAAAGLERELAGSDDTVAAGDIPDGDTAPSKVHKWWNSLNTAQQESALHNHGDRIGALDGIPATARDRANRATFAEDRANIKTRVAELDAKGELGIEEQREHDNLKDKLKGVDAINKRLEGHKLGKESYLLNFSPKGNGRAVVATGNPDTADNVVTSVPGMDADLEGMDLHLTRSERLLRLADDQPSDGDNAAVTWLGYEAPQGLSSAGSDGYAEDAAGHLQNFQDGLRATHEGAASTNTLIGHSYGSTAVGEAAQYGDGKLDADNVVLIGSPGVNADSVSDLQLPNDADVYASTAEHDIINNVYGADVALNSQGFPNIHGTPPVYDSFGAETFESDPGDEGSGPGGTSVKAHSQYWDLDSQSLPSMAKIVVNQEPY